jgi:hypothetical protein
MEGVPLWLMAGKNPAKLAETGKGCSPRPIAVPPRRIKYRFISMVYRRAPRGTQLASLLASDLLGSRR